MSENTTTNFPDDDIDPSLKGKDYCQKCAEALYNDWTFSMPKTMFAHAAAEYEIIKSYALGYQDITKYKPMIGVDESANDSSLLIDWTVRNIVGKFRRLALGKLQKTQYNLDFRPVDPLAKDEMSKYYAQIKAKVLLREMIMQQAPQLANSPALKKRFGDPEDMEELQMQIDYGSKTNLSIDAEEGTQVVFQDEENDIHEHRKNIFADLFDYDVSGFKTWIDENGRVRFRKSDMRNIVTNYCVYRDFRDLTKAGEIIAVDLSELAKYFGDEDMETIKNLAGSNLQFTKYNGAANMYGKTSDKNKVYVLDCQWLTYDTLVKEQSVDPSGNVALANTKYKNKNKTDKTVVIGGKEEPKYISKTATFKYSCKWVIGTDFCYEFGKDKDQPRSTIKKKASKTKLDYEFYAADFHEMRTNSIMKQLIPMADEYQLLVYRVQNLNNRMMPFGWAIDLDAIEDVAYGAGGTKLEPKEVLDMFFQGQLLLYRRKDVDRNNVNYKPIEVIQTSFAQEMVALYQHMASIVAQIRDISGLNELTDGSTAGQDRMPNPLIEANMESANNALYSIIDAEKKLLEKLAMSCFRKLQIALKRGDYGGYVKAIGTNTVKAITVAPRLALHEFAINAEVRPTDEMKQYLMGLMQKDVDQGFLDASDAMVVMDMYSTKKAYQLLTYRVKKNKQQMQQNALQQSQQNGNVQVQSAQAAEQAKQQTISIQHQFDMDYLNREIEGQLAVQELKNSGAEDAQVVGAKAKVMVAAMSGQGDGDGADSEGAGDNDAQMQEQSQIQPQGQPQQMQQPQQ